MYQSRCTEKHEWHKIANLLNEYKRTAVMLEVSI